jgi:hypothetical protein
MNRGRLSGGLIGIAQLKKPPTAAVSVAGGVYPGHHQIQLRQGIARWCANQKLLALFTDKFVLKGRRARALPAV